MDKELLKKLGLPTTKDIVYYPNKRKNETEKVTMIEIVDTFSDGEHTLCVTTETNRHVFMNSGFLRNMQAAQFVMLYSKVVAEGDAL